MVTRRRDSSATLGMTWGAVWGWWLLPWGMAVYMGDRLGGIVGLLYLAAIRREFLV